MPFTKTFHGFIENITDTLLVIEACRNGLLPTINRRLVERERTAIKSGTIIVFDESESGIKRWTDGFLWSPSRILGNFLVYRELANRENRNLDEDDFPPRSHSSHSSSSNNSTSTSSSSNSSEEDSLVLLHQRERALVGSLTTANTSYNFKKDGLIKKTIRILVNGNYLHIVSYYNKNDVLNNLLPTPSASPQLACLQISPDLMPHLQGHPYHHPSAIPSLSSSSSSSTCSVRKRSRSHDEQLVYHNRQRQRSSCHPAYPVYPDMLSSQPSLSNDYNTSTATPFYYKSHTTLPSLTDYQPRSKYDNHHKFPPSPPTTLPRVTTTTTTTNSTACDSYLPFNHSLEDTTTSHLLRHR